MNRRNFRYWVVIGLLASFSLLVLGRYAMLATEKGKDSETNLVDEDRGTISDRRGRLLAVDSPLYNIAVWRPETDKKAFPREASRLASIAGVDEAELKERWERGGADFFYLKKRVQPQVARAVQEAKAAGSFVGVVVEKVSGRLYPEKRLASHLLGFVGDGNRGLSGIESKYNEDLSPAGTKGKNIVLSIDADMQFALEEVARKARADTGAEAVMLIAADSRTAELLAYVAMPDFDPNEYFQSPSETWYDWPSVFAYEPGSVFKVFSMASVMDFGGVDSHTTFQCDGAYHRTTPSGEKITIKCLGAHGSVNIESILELSCNAGAAYAADRVQTLDFYEKLRGFGFGSRTGIALAGESPGQLRSPETWSLRSRPTIAMGQELLVSALQMTAAATAIANGGVLLKPIALRRILGPDGSTVYENSPQVVRRAVSADTAASILAAMEMASGESGTGKRAKIRDVRMAVKTGTAQMIDPATRRYSEKDFIASTVAIFPAEAPRIVVYLAIVKPTGESYYGGRIAAPVVKEAVEEILRIGDLPRGDSPTMVHSGKVTIPRMESLSIGATMPDLQGAPKRLLVSLLSRKDISVRILGDGYVVRQKPAPGMPVDPGTEVVLELE